VVETGFHICLSPFARRGFITGLSPIQLYQKDAEKKVAEEKVLNQYSGLPTGGGNFDQTLKKTYCEFESYKSIEQFVICILSMLLFLSNAVFAATCTIVYYRKSLALK
jgi:hypothetical protein